MRQWRRCPGPPARCQHGRFVTFAARKTQAIRDQIAHVRRRPGKAGCDVGATAYASQGWRKKLAEHVELYELAGGGHYFPRTRPADAGEAVLQSAGMLVSP